MTRRTQIIVLAWALLGLVDLAVKAAWFSGTSFEFDPAYWGLIKALQFLPWLVYTLIIFKIIDRWPELSRISPTTLALHIVLGGGLVLLHPLIVGLGMLSYGVPGTESASLSDFYRDVWLALILRDLLAVGAVFGAVTLMETLQRLRAAEVSQPSAEKNPATLILNKRNGTAIIPLAEVDWIRAAGNYSEIYVLGETHLTRETIGQLAERLNPEQFLRVHRSALVNRAKVKALNKTRHGWQVALTNDKTLPVSRRRIADVRELISA